jgi:predicted nucleic acid-binding protein
MKKMLIDTGPLISFFDESDRYSKHIRTKLQQFRGQLYTTEAVITELSYYFNEMKSAQLYIIEWISKGALSILPISDAEYHGIYLLMQKYQDTPMDFCDATLMYVGEREKIPDIATWDGDFRVYRYRNGSQLRIAWPI